MLSIAEISESASRPAFPARLLAFLPALLTARFLPFFLLVKSLFTLHAFAQSQRLTVRSDHRFGTLRVGNEWSVNRHRGSLSMDKE